MPTSNPDKIAFRFADADDLYAVHAGFYRNVRATRFEVVAALKRALEGRSVLDDGREASPMPPMASPMTTLYLTGHSLGGAMAALMAVMLSVEEEYVERFAPVFKGAYTYGAPMVGSPNFAEACAAHPFLDRNVVRYVYKRDPVLHLPPKDSDDFQHFGREYRYEGSYPWKDTSDDPDQADWPRPWAHRGSAGIRCAPVPAGARSAVPVPPNDHGPQHYISAITPPEVPNEFGDAYLIPAT